MGFLTSFVKNGEIRPSVSYKIILEQKEERNQLNSWKEQLVISLPNRILETKMWELEKHQPNIFQVSIHSDLLCLWSEALIDRRFIALGW